MNFSRLGLLTLAGFLASCSNALHSQAGLDLLHGVSSPPGPIATAIKTHHEATLVHQGKKFRFQLWGVADSATGRWEATGPLGISLATLVWSDSSWLAWLPGQSTLLRGKERQINLPVLDLREVDPSRVVAPYLGRELPAAGTFRKIPAEEGRTLLLPLEYSPRWSLLLDNRTGLPLRRQSLEQGRETEAFQFLSWVDQGGLLVPKRMVRTTPDGQRLELELKEWSRLAEVPPAALSIRTSPTTDTITVGKGENGRKIFQISQPLGEELPSAPPKVTAPDPASGPSSSSAKDGEDEEEDDDEEDETGSSASDSSSGANLPGNP